MKRITKFYQLNWRWFILGTLFLATFLNYFDRQTLGTAIDPIAKEFGLDNIQIGNLLSAFLVTYAWMHLIIGLIIDRIKNIRLFFMMAGLAVFVLGMVFIFIKPKWIHIE